LCFKRPGYGVSPLDKKKILGKRSSKNIEVDKIILIKNLY
jgi:sialic acid synthase SpsE